MKAICFCIALSLTPQTDRLPDAKFLDGLADRITKPLVKAADRIDKLAAAAEFFFSWMPWAGGGAAGLVVGYLLGDRRNGKAA
jgi:hypothetical protein